MRNLQGDVASTMKSGKIKKIVLKNFMCHSNFEVKLNPGVNIFMGLNGSGKSAILTAIAIGLGSKAASTARSTNLKDLVRRGEPNASIEITLSNEGIDAYDGKIKTLKVFLIFIHLLFHLENIFGKEITVVRNINGNTGSSSYKIKSQNGRVIYTNRQDLSKLTMCMNIQVENPVLILNQDAARSFLKECDPKKLYSFFMKATQIEAIIEKLNLCLISAVSSKNRLETLGKTIEHNETELESIRLKHTRLQSVERFRERIQECKNENDWLQVINAEKELQKAQTDLSNIQEELKQTKDLISNKTKYEKDIKEKIREMGTYIEANQKEAEEKRKAYEESRATYEAERDKYSEADNKIKEFTKMHAQVKENIANITKDIEDNENNPDNISSMKRQNEAKMNEIINRQKDIGAMIESANRDYKMFNSTLMELKEQYDNVKQKHDRETAHINQLDNQIKQCHNLSKDKMMAYGASMSRLLKDIDRERKFSEKPRGPIGRYIEVPDKKYRSAVENILGKTLTGFLVNSDGDRVILKRLIQNYPDLRNTSIITSAFQKSVYDINNGIVKVNEAVGVTLFNIIKVNDPVVMNCLIDLKYIERVVLVDDMNNANQITSDECNVPRNLQRVVLIHPFSEYYPAPNYRSYSLHENPVRYIQTSSADVIKGYEAQKVRAKERANRFSNEIKGYQTRIKEKEKQVMEKKRVINQLNDEKNKNNQKLNDLKAIEYPQDFDIEFKHKLLEEEKQKEVVIHQRVINIQKKINVLKEITEKVKEKMDQNQSKYKEACDEILKMQDGILTEQMKLNDMLKDIKTKSDQIQALKDTENNHLEAVRALHAKVADLMGKTRGIRVACNRTENEIFAEIRSTENRIARIESNNENIEDVALLLENKTKNLDDLRKVYAVLDNLLKKVNFELISNLILI